MQTTRVPSLREQLRRARHTAKLSQAALGERIGYSDRSTVSRFESGVSDIGYEQIERWADACGFRLLLVPLDGPDHLAETLRDLPAEECATLLSLASLIPQLPHTVRSTLKHLVTAWQRDYGSVYSHFLEEERRLVVRLAKVLNHLPATERELLEEELERWEAQYACEPVRVSDLQR